MRVTDKYVFFWQGEFSNWHNCELKHKGVKFYNSEAAFMYEKALLFNDIETANKIKITKNPKVAKSLGRSVKNFDSTLWDNEKEQIMINVLYSKFSQNPDLKSKLLSYGNKKFVEASPFDLVWGVGLDENNPLINNSSNWKGENLLGKCLNIVKNKIK